MTVQQAAWTYLTLLLFVALTVGSTFIPLGVGNSLVNIGFALGKAALIGLVFMHLRRSSVLVSLAVFALMLWLTILFGVALIDFLVR